MQINFSYMIRERFPRFNPSAIHQFLQPPVYVCRDVRVTVEDRKLTLNSAVFKSQSFLRLWLMLSFVYINDVPVLTLQIVPPEPGP